MKPSLASLLAALLLLVPISGTASAESASISTMSYHTFSNTASVGNSRSASSLFYTDSAGRLTNFEMESESGVMTLTIRQDGAVMWSRSFPEETIHFSVSRRESNGEVCFLITAGARHLRAAPSQDGLWQVTEISSR